MNILSDISNMNGTNLPPHSGNESKATAAGVPETVTTPSDPLAASIHDPQLVEESPSKRKEASDSSSPLFSSSEVRPAKKCKNHLAPESVEEGVDTDDADVESKNEDDESDPFNNKVEEFMNLAIEGVLQNKTGAMAAYVATLAATGPVATGVAVMSAAGVLLGGASSYKMDAKLTTLQEDVEVIDGKLTTLQEDVEVLKTDVAVLKTDVAVLKTDVAVLKTDVAYILKILEGQQEGRDQELKDQERRYQDQERRFQDRWDQERQDQERRYQERRAQELQDEERRYQERQQRGSWFGGLY